MDNSVLAQSGSRHNEIIARSATSSPRSAQNQEVRREIRMMLTGLPADVAAHLGSYLEEVWEQLDEQETKDPISTELWRMIRLVERLDLQAFQEQERTHQAKLEVQRLGHLKATEALLLEKARLDRRSELLRDWAGIAGKFVVAFAGAGGIGTAIVAAMAAQG